MATNRYPLIAREGWPFLAVVVIAAVIVLRYAGLGWSLPLWLMLAGLFYLYRDPQRSIPTSPLAVVSPADGRIAAVEQKTDPYLHRKAVCVSIQMRPWNVFSTRAPVEGKMLEVHTDGDGPGGNGEATPHGVWLHTDEADELIMVVHRGPLHNLPRCYVGIGERVGQGQRCGFIPLGSRVDVYLPPSSRVAVNEHDRVKAGQDVIATLVHR